MGKTRLPDAIFTSQYHLKKMLGNSTIAFPFYVSLFPSTLAHFHCLEILQIAHTLARFGGVGKVLPKPLQLEREGEMTFVYILLLRSKNIFQALKQLEEGAHQAFYNCVAHFRIFFFCFPIHAQYIWEHLLNLVGERVRHCQ